MTEAKKTSIPRYLVDRVTAGVRYALTGDVPQSWMGPAQPIKPTAQEVAGRQFDFPVGYNLQQQPRAGEGVNFAQLRALADACDLVRLAVETRKDQLCALDWTIKPRDPKQKAGGDKRIEDLILFLQFPDRVNSWDQWLRMVVEDLLVIDAPTVYPRLTKGGEIYALEVIDGATIKRVLNTDGRTPMAPDPAYQQVLHGVSAVDYSADELVYRPRNPRSWKVYGYSPVEQVLITVNIALRRQLHKLQYYTEGSAPDLLFELPADWTPDQIKKFSDWFWSLLSGNTAQRQKGIFVPAGAKPIDLKEKALVDQYDEWLARVIMYAFSLPPSAFTRQMNRATAESAQEAAEDEGLVPLMRWVEHYVNFILQKYFKVDDLVFGWQTLKELDPVEQAKIDDQQLRSGQRTINELRIRDGMEKLEGGDEPLIYTASGATLLQDVLNPPEPPPALAATAGAPAAPGAKKPGDEEKPPKKDDAAEKLRAAELRKARQRILKPLDRKRPSVRKAANKLTGELTAFLKAQSKEIGKRIGARVGELTKAEASIEAVIEDILGTVTFSDTEVFGNTVGEILAAMAQEGGTMALRQVGVTANESITAQVNTRAVLFAQDRGAELVTDIEATTREQLRSVVTEAIEEGWSNTQTRAAIRDSFSFSDSRADMIARTEIAKADARGNFIAYQESGVVSGKTWLLSNDHDQDDECNDNADAGIIDLDDAFPSGDTEPPAHPNCECDFAPVVDQQPDDASSDDES